VTRDLFLSLASTKTGRSVFALFCTSFLAPPTKFLFLFSAIFNAALSNNCRLPKVHLGLGIVSSHIFKHKLRREIDKACLKMEPIILPFSIIGTWITYHPFDLTPSDCYPCYAYYNNRHFTPSFGWRDPETHKILLFCPRNNSVQHIWPETSRIRLLVERSFNELRLWMINQMRTRFCFLLQLLLTHVLCQRNNSLSVTWKLF